MFNRMLHVFLQHSYKKNAKYKRLVRRLNNIHEWDYGIEAAWRCVHMLPDENCTGGLL